MTHSDLDQQVARTMEADVRILPLLPELLADLQELGTSAYQVESALRSVGVKPGSTVLDLGCGKGAVAVTLAERLEVRVEGIDAFPPFLDAARTLAAQREVSSRCIFRQRDICELLGKRGRYDVVLLLSVGPVSGDHQKTIGDLRTLARKCRLGRAEFMAYTTPVEDRTTNANFETDCSAAASFRGLLS